VVSGRLAAEAILSGQPASYPERLRNHPTMVDYRRIHRLREAGAALSQRGRPRASNGNGSRIGKRAVATGFAWMFSGSRLPAARLIDLALAGAERWLGAGVQNGRE